MSKTNIGELTAAEIAKMSPLERVTYQREREAELEEIKLAEKHGRLVDPDHPDPILSRLRTTLPKERPEITQKAAEYLAKVQENRDTLWFIEIDAKGQPVDNKSIWRVNNIFPIMGEEQRGPNLMVHLLRFSATETIEKPDGKRAPKPKMYADTPNANTAKSQVFIVGWSWNDKINENELSLLGDDFVKRFKQHTIEL